MNTQVLHYKALTGNNNTDVYAIEERLNAADLERIAKNCYPVSMVKRNPEDDGEYLFNSLSPVDIIFYEAPVSGKIAEFTAVIPMNSAYTLLAKTGSYIMANYEGITGLDPDLVYLVYQLGE